MRTFKNSFVFLVILLIYVGCQKEQTPLSDVNIDASQLENLTIPSAYIPKPKDLSVANLSLRPTAIAQSRSAQNPEELNASNFFVQSTTAGQGNSYENNYGFGGEDAFYIIGGDYSFTSIIDLYDLEADLDIFLFELDANNNPTNLVAYSWYVDNSAERIIAELERGKKYGLLIDAQYNNVTSSFSLKLTEAASGSGINRLGINNPLLFQNKVSESSFYAMKANPGQTKDPIIESDSVVSIRPNDEGLIFPADISLYEQTLLDHFYESYIGSWKMRIEQGKNAYIVLQKTPDPSGETFAHVYFGSDGSIQVLTHGQTFNSPKSYTQGEWIDLYFDIKFNADNNKHVLTFGMVTEVDNLRIIGTNDIFKITANSRYEDTQPGIYNYGGLGFYTTDSNSSYLIGPNFLYPGALPDLKSRGARALDEVDIEMSAE